MRTRAELEQASADAEQWLDDHPELPPSDYLVDLQRLRRAIDSRDAAETELHAAVGNARMHGRTWAEIGHAFGISRQSAQERFGSRRVTETRRKVHG